MVYNFICVKQNGVLLHRVSDFKFLTALLLNSRIRRKALLWLKERSTINLGQAPVTLAAFADSYGSDLGITAPNGTVSLKAVLPAFGISKNGEIIVSPISFIAACPCGLQADRSISTNTGTVQAPD